LLILEPGLQTDIQAHPTLVLAPQTARIQLDLRLKSQDFPRYTAVVETADGRALFKRTSLRPVAEAREPVLRLWLDAGALPDGSYIVRLLGAVALRGSTSADTPTEAGAYAFRVRRNK
jgi:hypothetical protein